MPGSVHLSCVKKRRSGMEEYKRRHNSVNREDSLSVKELFESASWWARCSERRDLLRLATAISLMEVKLQTYEEASASSPGESQQSGEVKESSQGLSGGFTVLGLQMCGRLLKQAKEAFAMSTPKPRPAPVMSQTFFSVMACSLFGPRATTRPKRCPENLT